MTRIGLDQQKLLLILVSAVMAWPIEAPLLVCESSRSPFLASKDKG